MTKLEDLLKKTVQFTHTNGSHINISPEVAASAVKQLMLELIGETNSFENNAGKVWIDPEQLRAKVEAL